MVKRLQLAAEVAASDPPAPRSVPVTALVAVKNEHVNIERCLHSLAPASHVVVLDSQSSDGTADMAAALGATVHQFEYRGGFPKKRQWAIDSLSFETEWLLLVDADEQVPPTLWHEIQSAVASAGDIAAYFIRKEFHFLGRRFRYGGFSFQVVALLKRGKARFEYLLDDGADGLDMEVHERLIVDGPIGVLRTGLIHHDYKGLEAFIARHNKYSTWEAKLRATFLCGGGWGRQSIVPKIFGNAQERRRFLKFIAVKMPCEPLLWFLYHYVWRAAFLEGRRGYIASRLRANYISDVRAKVYERIHSSMPKDDGHA